MLNSLNFLVPNSPCDFVSSSFRSSRRVFTNKRRRHSQAWVSLDLPRRPTTSLSVQDDPSPQPGIPDPPSSLPNPSKPDSKHFDQGLREDQLTASNGTPGIENTITDDSTKSDVQSSSQVKEKSEGAVPITIGPLSFSIPAPWLLYSVPFLWGSFGPAVRLLFSQQPHQDPSVFNTERLLLSTLVYVPVLLAEFQAFRQQGKGKKSDGEENPFAFFPAGVELGIYVFLANVCQVIGLQQTSASRAAFLVQLQTVIVPVLSGLFGIDQISAQTWISSLVAVAGVALLSSDKGHGTVSSVTGDSLEILSAFFFSTYIIRLGKYCNSLPANPLVATKIATQALLSIGWALTVELGNLLNHPTHIPSESGVSPWTLAAITTSIGVVAWTGLMSSAVSGWAQTKGQQGVPASQAVVIFATQPLWASALAALVLGESFGPRGFAGGALIIAATLLATKKKEESDKVKDT